MRSLLEFLHESLHQKEEEFLKRHPDPVLVHRLKKHADIDISAATQFVPSFQKGASAPGSIIVANTRAMVHLSRALGALGPTTPQTIEDGSILVFPIARPPTVPAKDPLTVGRSGAAINLPFPKISKLHAHFMLSEGHVYVADAGSRNGTEVASKPLSQGQRVEIEDGTLIQFSQYAFIFFTARGFCKLLIGG